MFLDDLGTDYASPTHLVTVPVDTIKIDRSFMARLWPDDPSLVLVEALIDIARKLGISVVAEGIETVDHANQLWRWAASLGRVSLSRRWLIGMRWGVLLRRHAQGDGGLPMVRREDGLAEELDGAVPRVAAGRG